MLYNIYVLIFGGVIGFDSILEV